MATTFQMPKVSRGAKLQPPAPLKKKVDSSNANNNNSLSEDNSLQTVNSANIFAEKKENVIVRNGRIGASRRNLKLEKPRPLKATRADLTSSEQENNIITKTTVFELTKEQVELSRKLSPKTAQRTADKLIKETLQELDDLSPVCKAPSDEMRGRTRVLSQVSHDSGYSETSVYSRQGSMLESLEESYQDDVVWKSMEEETDTFTPDKSHPGSNVDRARSTPVTAGDTVEDCNTEVYKDEGIDLCEQVLERLCTKENLVLPKFTRGQKTFYPEDVKVIEMELESMRDELGDSEQSLDSLEEVNNFESNSENHRLRKIENSNSFGTGSKSKTFVLKDSWHVILREPICPTTMLENILKVDRHLPGGPYSAKGRRRMFRSYKICSKDEQEPLSTFIQYSAEELINFGSSSLCRQRPDSWDYLTVVLPEVCLSTVNKYFDCQSYLDERSYVEEQTGYVKDMGLEWNTGYEKNSRLQTQTRDFKINGANNNVTEQPLRGGFGRPPSKHETSLSHQISSTFNQTGFNDFFPFKNNFDTRCYQTGSSSFIPDLDQVDLDTKSDVRIRNKNQFNNGKLFSAARNDLLDSVNKKQTWPDRPAMPLSVQWSEGTRSRNVSGESEELYLNRNLPQQCPW